MAWFEYLRPATVPHRGGPRAARVAGPRASSADDRACRRALSRSRVVSPVPGPGHRIGPIGVRSGARRRVHTLGSGQRPSAPPTFASVALGNRHPLHGRRESLTTSCSRPDRGCSQVDLEVLNGLAVHSGSATAGFDPQIGFPHQLLGDVEGLCYVHRLLPCPVGLRPTLNDATPWLQPVSRPSSLLRVAPPLCPASVRAPLQGPPAWALPFASGRQVPTFRMKAWSTLTPPLCRTPPSQSAGSFWVHPGPITMPGFDVVEVLHDTSSAVHSRSSSWTSPDVVWPRRFPRRSPPGLLTPAARGGLGPEPAPRSRGAVPHLPCSMACSLPPFGC